MKKLNILLILISSSLFAQTQLNSFSPEPGKYIVSAWVKEARSDQPTTYTSELIVQVQGLTDDLLEFNDNIPTDTDLNVVFKPSGRIIDGWQRIVGVVEMPDYLLSPDILNASFSIYLKCNYTLGDCFYDDIRFYPYNGNMKSFVYDEDTQRLMAELDENNYATFYEYDLEGGLVRIKKETEKGVFTIQETRSNNTKK